MSLRNRKIASIISKGAGLIGAAIVLTAIAFPGPIQVIGGIIFIVYLVIGLSCLPSETIVGASLNTDAVLDRLNEPE